MPSFAKAYAIAWGIVILAGPVACSYGLIRSPTSPTRRRISVIAILGLLLSAMLAFSLATTVLQPLAIVVLPAPLIFAFAIISPSIFAQKGVRIYLVSCMVAGELLWMWVCWSQFARSGS